MQLFSTGPRTDPAICRPTEGQYAFYDRNALPYFARIREVLESWFALLPPRMQRHVAATSRCGDNGKWLSAFWEIYLYRLFRGLGYGVTYEPQLPHTKRSPDFFVEGAAAAAYVEARAVIGETAGDAQRAQVEEAISEVFDPNFAVWVSWEREHHQLPSLSRLKKEIAAWLAAQDPAEIDALGPIRSLHQLPTLEWKDRGWTIEFQPMLKPEDVRGVRGAFPTIAGSSMGMRLSRDREGIRSAICKKSSRYGDLEHPHVVALLCNHTFVNDEDIIDALFGFTAMQVTFAGDGRVVSTESIRQPNGAWRGRRGAQNTRSSAILVARGLGPFNLASSTPQLWHHPSPARELALPLPFPAKRLEVTDGKGVLVDQPRSLDSPIHTALGIPHDWGSEDPWREATTGDGGREEP